MGLSTLAKLLLPISAALIVPAYLRRLRQQRQLAARCAATRTLVLSYDDGPGRQLTPALMDLLGTHGAKGSFFLIGDRALEQPEVVDRLVAEGHEVGCHGCRHVHAWYAPIAAVRDIDDGYKALARWIPPHATFRPPYGKLSLSTWRAVRRRGAPLGWWTIDSGDIRGYPVERTVTAVRRAGGGVVLMHDFDRKTDRGARVLQITEALLRAAGVDGWNVRPLRGVMDVDGMRDRC